MGGKKAGGAICLVDVWLTSQSRITATPRGLCSGQSDFAEGFLGVLPFPLPSTPLFRPFPPQQHHLYSFPAPRNTHYEKKSKSRGPSGSSRKLSAPHLQPEALVRRDARAPPALAHVTHHEAAPWGGGKSTPGATTPQTLAGGGGGRTRRGNVMKTQRELKLKRGSGKRRMAGKEMIGEDLDEGKEGKERVR
ncbi:Protein of unknown function [Gryllus bimaculatus]|nr:Protein of unknown function [Gryllus bimaculatus]